MAQLQPGPGPVISVSALPSYGGFASKVSAEEWLRQINARVVAQGLGGQAAVAFARQQLTQQAALLFGEDGSAFDRTNRAAADVDWALWQSLFKARYFASNTQAETLAEWTTIRQLPAERAVDTMQRASHSFRVFFDAVNGTEPIPARAGQPRVFALSAVSRQQLEAAAPALKDAFRIVAQQLVDNHPGWLQAQAYAVIQAEHLLQAGAAQAAGAAALEQVPPYDPILDPEELEQVLTLAQDDCFAAVGTHYLNHIVQQVYVDLYENTSRAMVLQALKTALTKPKCKEEVYKFLRDPTLPLDELCTALKQLDFADQGLTGAVRPNARMGIGATDEVYESSQAGGDSGTSSSAAAADPVLARMAKLELEVAAFKAKKPANAPTGGQQQQQQQQQDKKNLTCSYCSKKGHLEKTCWTKRRHKKEAAALSAEPAEN